MEASPAQISQAVQNLYDTYPFPPEPLLLYLFHPLLESGLGQVVHNLEQSLQIYPRPVIILYHNPQLANVLDASPALEKAATAHQYSIYRTI